MTPYEFTKLTDADGCERIVNLAQIKYINKVENDKVFVSFGEGAYMYLTKKEAEKLFDELGFYL